MVVITDWNGIPGFLPILRMNFPQPRWGCSPVRVRVDAAFGGPVGDHRLLILAEHEDLFEIAHLALCKTTEEHHRGPLHEAPRNLCQVIA